MGSRDLNSGPLACTDSSLLAESSLQPQRPVSSALVLYKPEHQSVRSARQGQQMSIGVSAPGSLSEAFSMRFPSQSPRTWTLSGSSGWFLCYHVSKDGLELLLLLPHPPKCRDDSWEVVILHFMALSFLPDGLQWDAAQPPTSTHHLLRHRNTVRCSSILNGIDQEAARSAFGGSQVRYSCTLSVCSFH